MPTIDRVSGFRVVIYPNDHEPSHVHVFKSGGEAKIQLLNAPEFISVTRMKDKDAYKALDIIIQNREKYLKEWDKYHGCHG